MMSGVRRATILISTLLVAFLGQHCAVAFAPATSLINKPTQLRARPLFETANNPKLAPGDTLPNELPQIPFVTKTVPSDRSQDLQIGEDCGVFDIQQENWGSLGDRGWYTFCAAVATILTAVAVLWVYPPTGYADDFTAGLESIAGGNPHIVTLLFGIIFPIVHSGLASLRPYGEQVVGARMWRVIFAFPSLCLSYSWIAYFIAHVHDGYTFYDLSHNPAAHTIAWLINFASFFFLYPSVFNLKEVAAVEIPKIHLWETGMIRITRHPQFVGQVMWSAAHLAMVGTTFTALTMALLVGHHAFACWNGDRRLYQEHGEDFLKVKERTSIVPFQAILEGRQVLPKDVYKEFLRGPYAVIAVFTLGAYFAHPYMQGGAALVKNTGLVQGGILDGLFS
ncbi:isomerase activity [Seminavis robusta]|uniref:Isomerase activity n=1 Tax=Seminavis robusta TaxID=568900 RepID=A0A9N8EZ27_9STRA|nr:isomerase activity [Seminavis robusta]|eukprot:Sro2261_g321180.1 isomerase activity (394) ;mRNA; f:13222-14403